MRRTITNDSHRRRNFNYSRKCCVVDGVTLDWPCRSYLALKPIPKFITFVNNKVIMEYGIVLHLRVRQKPKFIFEHNPSYDKNDKLTLFLLLFIFIFALKRCIALNTRYKFQCGYSLVQSLKLL